MRNINRWIQTVGLIAIGVLIGINISRTAIRYQQRQVEKLLWLLTPATEWVRQRVHVLEDSFGLDRAAAIEILSEVWKSSQYFEHDPDIVLAIIEQESSFKRNALSSTGAMGLMQVMPEWWKRYNPNADFFSIKENIRLGCFVLWTYKNISQNEEEALARYYAGKNWDKFLVYSEEVQNKCVKWINRED